MPGRQETTDKQSWSPLEASRLLNVSTTTLRRYEELKLIPDVPRTGNRRRYGLLHMHAFTALRKLLQGYGVPATYEVMKMLRAGRADDAVWLINRQLADLQEEKHRVAEMKKLIAEADFSKYRGRSITDTMTIREVSEIAGVNASAVRHWEQEGLIFPVRNPHNGYRIFGPKELRRIIVISSLRRTVYFIENMRALLEDLDTQNLAAVEESFEIALGKLDVQLHVRYQGIAAMVRYNEEMNKTSTDGDLFGQ